MCAKNVIINDGGYRYGNWAFDIFKNTEDNDFVKYRKITHKYILFSDNVIEKYKRIKKEFFSETDVICGVLCRGGGYTENKPANHPVQPELCDVMKEIDYAIENYHCNKIYLATDDAKAYATLFDKYGESLVCIRDFFDDRIETRANNGNDDFISQAQKICKGENYAASILMLSKCDCLVAGNTSGSIAARLLSDGYKYEKVFDLGRY